MKKLNEFSLVERVLTVLSVGWFLFIVFVAIHNCRPGDIGCVLLALLFFGVVPPLLVSGGILWILAAPKKPRIPKTK